jgi:hypothetical protein
MAETIVSGERHYLPSPSLPDLRLRFAIEDTSGKMSLQTSGDGGTSWQAIASEPPSNVGVGWVPTISEDKSIRWLPISEVVRSGDQVVPSYLQAWTDFSFPAELQNNVQFGMFDVPTGLRFEAYGLQVSVFSPPQINDLTITLINSNSQTPIYNGGPFLFDAGIQYKSYDFPDPILLLSGSKTSAKINFANENAFPGSFLVARLLLRGV